MAGPVRIGNDDIFTFTFDRLNLSILGCSEDKDAGGAGCRDLHQEEEGELRPRLLHRILHSKYLIPHVSGWGLTS